MVNNIWVELQEVRTIIARLKKLKEHDVEESEKTGLFCIIDKDGNVVYEATSYDSERVLMYAVQCHKTGGDPNAIDLSNFDPMD